MSFIPSLLRVFTGAIVLFGASLFLNIGGDTGSFEALLVMGAQAKEKCIKVDGKRVCFEEGAKKKKAKKKDDGDNNDDDDDNDKVKGEKKTGDDDGDDDQAKGEKKTKDEDTGLTECSVLGPNSGGGCKTGKWVCETMKSGKKCCGCVPDPNAKPAEKKPRYFTCKSNVENVDGSVSKFPTFSSAGIQALDATHAENNFIIDLPKMGLRVKGPVTCKERKSN